MIVLRSLVFQCLFYVWTVLCVTVTLPVLAMPRRYSVAVAHVWGKVSMWLLNGTVGLDCRVRSAEHIPDGGAVFAIKHQSAWETVAVNVLLLDAAIVLKRELFRIPCFGWFLRRVGHIGIDRTAGGAALRAMVHQARAVVDAGRPVIMFPEGTRSAVGARTRYHPGIYALYAELGVPVVPVALNSGVFWGRREFAKRPGTVTVEFLEPIQPGRSRREFMATLTDRIETATQALVEDATH